MTGIREIIVNSFRNIIYLLLLFPVLWILSGFYSVDQNEIAVPVILGKIGSFTNAGIHYNFPAPLGEVFIADIKTPRTVSIGYGSLDYDGLGSSNLNGTIIKYTGNSKETVFVDKNIFDQQFMTGDENIIAVEIEISFNISSPEQWFFNYRNPQDLISSSAKQLLFQTISSSTIDNILVRDSELELQLKEKLQNELNSLECGVQISSVVFKNVNLPVRNVEEAYRDVKSAEDDRTKRVEEARREASVIIAEAESEARKLNDKAIIESTNITNRALTEQELFTKMIISREIENEFDYRLYLETLEMILGKGQSYIIKPQKTLDTIYIDQKGE